VAAKPERDACSDWVDSLLLQYGDDGPAEYSNDTVTSSTVIPVDVSPEGLSDLAEGKPWVPELKVCGLLLLATIGWFVSGAWDIKALVYADVLAVREDELVRDSLSPTLWFVRGCINALVTVEAVILSEGDGSTAKALGDADDMTRFLLAVWRAILGLMTPFAYGTSSSKALICSWGYSFALSECTSVGTIGGGWWRMTGQRESIIKWVLHRMTKWMTNVRGHATERKNGCALI
jgi:hypothetical protein